MKLERFFRFLSVSILSVCLFLSVPLPIHAQSEDVSPAEEISVALDSENDIYAEYTKFIEDIESLSADEIRNTYRINSIKWNADLNEAKDVYTRYTNIDDDIEIQTIAQNALGGTNKALSALENYDRALLTDNLTSEGIDDAIARGDNLILEAVTEHDVAVDGINEYTGASDDIELMGWLTIFTIASGILSLILFFKSRTDSIYNADIVRAEIYKDLLISSLWMFIGFLVTAGGLYYALYQGGGEYYILYGAVLVGGWGFSKGLWKYWFKDRAILRELKSESRKKMISEVLKNIKPHE